MKTAQASAVSRPPPNACSTNVLSSNAWLSSRLAAMLSSFPHRQFAAFFVMISTSDNATKTVLRESMACPTQSRPLFCVTDRFLADRQKGSPRVAGVVVGDPQRVGGSKADVVVVGTVVAIGRRRRRRWFVAPRLRTGGESRQSVVERRRRRDARLRL